VVSHFKAVHPAKGALSENFDAVCGNYLKALKKSFVDVLLRMVA
jgi:hypothetical protein